MDYNIYTYIVFNVSELNKVDFSQVKETSVDTVRKSLDGTKTFISFPSTPTFLDELTTKQGPYNYPTLMDILNTFEWRRLSPQY